MRIYISIIFIFILQACNDKDSTCDWKGGEIRDFGTYCTGDLKIKVYEENNYMRYEARNYKDKIILKYDMNISTVHHWGLFLDNDRNVWVFSSDVGDAVWKKNPVTGRYDKKMFHHFLTKDSVPGELYASSLKRFLK